MEKLYLDIGSVFEIEGKKYIVVKEAERYIGCSACVDCAFQNIYCYGDDRIPECADDERKDNTGVFFKECK